MISRRISWVICISVASVTVTDCSSISVAAPAASGTSPHPASQPHSAHSHHSWTAASTAPTTAAYCHTPTPDDTTISRLRSLSPEEKGRRLIEAAMQGTVEDLVALMAAGADLGARDVDGMSALHWAAREGQLEAARCLIGRGAALDARGRAWWTPLHVAAGYGNVAVLKLLLVASADCNATDVYERTPLHWAALNNHAEAVAALLEAGADRAATDNRGKTPLDLARQQDIQQLEDTLRLN